MDQHPYYAQQFNPTRNPQNRLIIQTDEDIERQKAKRRKKFTIPSLSFSELEIAPLPADLDEKLKKCDSHSALWHFMRDELKYEHIPKVEIQRYLRVRDALLNAPTTIESDSKREWAFTFSQFVKVYTVIHRCFQNNAKEGHLTTRKPRKRTIKRRCALHKTLHESFTDDLDGLIARARAHVEVGLFDSEKDQSDDDDDDDDDIFEEGSEYDEEGGVFRDGDGTNESLNYTEQDLAKLLERKRQRLTSQSTNGFNCSGEIQLIVYPDIQTVTIKPINVHNHGVEPLLIRRSNHIINKYIEYQAQHYQLPPISIKNSLKACFESTNGDIGWEYITSKHIRNQCQKFRLDQDAQYRKPGKDYTWSMTIDELVQHLSTKRDKFVYRVVTLNPEKPSKAVVFADKRFFRSMLNAKLLIMDCTHAITVFRHSKLLSIVHRGQGHTSLDCCMLFNTTVATQIYMEFFKAIETMKDEINLESHDGSELKWQPSYFIIDNSYIERNAINLYFNPNQIYINTEVFICVYHKGESFKRQLYRYSPEIFNLVMDSMYRFSKVGAEESLNKAIQLARRKRLPVSVENYIRREMKDLPSYGLYNRKKDVLLLQIQSIQRIESMHNLMKASRQRGGFEIGRKDTGQSTFQKLERLFKSLHMKEMRNTLNKVTKSHYLSEIFNETKVFSADISDLIAHEYEMSLQLIQEKPPVKAIPELGIQQATLQIQTDHTRIDSANENEDENIQLVEVDTVINTRNLQSKSAKRVKSIKKRSATGIPISNSRFIFNKGNLKGSSSTINVSGAESSELTGYDRPERTNDLDISYYMSESSTKCILNPSNEGEMQSCCFYKAYLLPCRHMFVAHVLNYKKIKWSEFTEKFQNGGFEIYESSVFIENDQDEEEDLEGTDESHVILTEEQEKLREKKRVRLKLNSEMERLRQTSFILEEVGKMNALSEKLGDLKLIIDDLNKIAWGDSLLPDNPEYVRATGAPGQDVHRDTPFAPAIQ